MKPLCLATLLVAWLAGAALAAMADPPTLPPRGVEGPDIRSRVEPKGLEGPDVRRLPRPAEGTLLAVGGTGLFR
ncbi:MAG TPA: hypothetical protein VLT62_25105 [Candidatus Methylomirabilis sp.]|nr:hypothetical protein [Candidatus Methylomirabilis sp.]